MNNLKSKEYHEPGLSRRGFLKLAGTVSLATGAGVVLSELIWVNNTIAAIPASEGYLLVDTKKCQGCMSCMLACSLVHEGVESLSLARIQVIQNSFEKWPYDLGISQCRQCVEPACVEACSTGALHADGKYGNVRIVDPLKCNGCKACIEACPYEPSKTVWDFEEKQAQKCDLCAEAPYHWDKKGGGPNGKQACVEVCPVGAIQFAKKIPMQKGDQGYNVNLRGDSWMRLGYPTD